MINSQHRRVGDYVVWTVVVHDKRTEEVKPEWNMVAEASPTNPHLSQVTSEELVLIETYLHRRVDLDLAVRDTTAYKTASRITQKTGLQRDPNQSLDDFLEGFPGVKRRQAIAFLKGVPETFPRPIKGRAIVI